MKQFEAVIKIMEENGGFATLGHLYQHALKITDCEWKTKTPYASIRRIVQDDRIFFKIKPGLWALKSQKDEVLKKFSLDEKSSIKKKEEFNHTYFQGLLAEIGNVNGFETHVPNQDKNKLFLDKPLKEIIILENIRVFTYPDVVKKAQTVDVVWFNKRRFPSYFFEVEHTTSFDNSLLKFLELQDFHSKFFIVSHNNRKQSFLNKINGSAFQDIESRIKFLDYEKLSELHHKTFEYYKVQKLLI